jgi:hypothetical protein
LGTYRTLDRSSGRLTNRAEGQIICVSWVNVITSLATVVVTLAAVYAAARWKEKADDRAWLRQQRLESYRDLLTIIDRVVEAASDAIAITVDSPEARTKSLKQLLDYVHDLDRSATGVGLVAPPQLAKLGHEIAKSAFEKVWPASAQTHPEQLISANWEEGIEQLVQQYRRFRALARVDLGTDREVQEIPTAWAGVSKAQLLSELDKGDDDHSHNSGKRIRKASDSQPSDP